MTNDSVTPSSGINEASFIAITGMPEITEGADLAGMISNAIETQGTTLKSGDIVVVTQKVVSKAEGRTVDLTTVTPSEFARIFAGHSGRDPRLVELVISESVEIVRMKPDRGILITETRHGFICANSGIDSSNVVGDETVTLLPEDPDGSARELLRRLRNETGIRELAVIITDTFGRAWREGHVNFAIGLAGMDPFMDYRGQPDAQSKVMAVTRIAVADEVAAASELVMGKIDRVPVAIARGVRYVPGDGSARELMRERAYDLFR
ncbi:MAG: coenzyme F420-0:L-glutamate ligase [Dehalococcoidia bacterium]|nr:coenzyme F420-0:L-glutamate ligase [Dehalococcoidia bacterium]